MEAGEPAPLQAYPVGWKDDTTSVPMPSLGSAWFMFAKLLCELRQSALSVER
jgi:hypothetical protein